MLKKSVIAFTPVMITAAEFLFSPSAKRQLPQWVLVEEAHQSLDVVEGSIAINSATIVEELASRTDIAIVFRFVSETLGAKEWAPLAVDTVTGPHVGSDAPIG
jgi:hypothetical protein